jgi:UDP-N-acetylmuramate--alanine ligase
VKLTDINHVYFIGIGGIGMSAIARYFVAHGKIVSGYDRTRTTLTDQLVKEGMMIHYEDDASLIPTDLDLVIYTPAIPKEHNGFAALKDLAVPVMKRSEALGLISNEMKSIGVAGTHGKTTTSSMITHVLKVGGIDVSAFLGGITVDYNSNFIIGKSDVVVLEADEYDRSFLQLKPLIATISSMDPDHLDIYGDRDEMIEGGYKAYAGRIRDNGYLIIKGGLLDEFTLDELAALVKRGIQVFEYGFETSQIRISKIRVEGGKYLFDYDGLGSCFRNVILNMPGTHNVENATVAISVGLLNGVSEINIRRALSEFKGIQRRFELIADSKAIIFIDDYAHHPGELKVAIDAARTLYPDKKLTGIFQPHLYSRTRDFADGFAEELDKLDVIFLMDIYPAREVPIERVTSEIIYQKMKNPNKRLVSKSTLMEDLKKIKSEIEVLLTLGAGDIDTFVPKIKEMLF